MARKKRREVLEKDEDVDYEISYEIMDDKIVNTAEVKIGNEYLPKGAEVTILKIDGDIAYVKHEDRVYQIGVSSLTFSRAQEVNK